MDPIGSYSPTKEDVSATADVSPKKFRATECHECHQVLPKNRLFQQSISIVSGVSSGASWSSSPTNSSNAKGNWQPSRISAGRRRGYSSGRTYYKTKNIWLCLSCNEKFLTQLERDRQLFINILIAVAVVIVICLVTYKFH